MTEYDSESLSFESPEQEKARLREENARLRRLLSTHGIAIPQWPPTIPSPVKVAESMKVDREERARKNRTIPEPVPREGRCLRAAVGARRRSLRIFTGRHQELEGDQREPSRGAN